MILSSQHTKEMSDAYLSYAADLLTVQNEKLDVYLMKLYCVWDVLMCQGEGVDVPTTIDMEMFLASLIPGTNVFLKPEEGFFDLASVPGYADRKITATVTPTMLKDFVTEYDEAN